MSNLASRRAVGNAPFSIAPVAMGCWPVAGIAGSNVTEAMAIATIQACFANGVNHLDTAFGYGLNGESERRIAAAIRSRRNEMVIATKGGITTEADGSKRLDARPQTLRHQCETSLSRLGTDRVELYYLHAPDPAISVAESAGAIKELLQQGKVLAAGASNCDIQQLQEFVSVCPLTAVQMPFNMLQQGIQRDIVPWCLRHGVSVIAYWPLMKGLLSGKLPRNYVFALDDRRTRYPMFQAAEWHKNQDLIDQLSQIAREAGRTVAQVVINWTINQPGITAVLCGAKTPDQISESGGALGWRLGEEHMELIATALADRGEPVTATPV